VVYYTSNFLIMEIAFSKVITGYPSGPV